MLFMKLSNYSLALALGLRQIDLLIVESRHANLLDLVADGMVFARYDPSSRPPFWCLRFWFYRVFLVKNIPRDAKTLVAISKTIKPLAIISSDSYETLHTASPYLSNVHLYFVQHGLYLDQRELAIKRKPTPPDHESVLTLFSISNYDILNYRKRGIRPRRIIPTGTLMNSAYMLHEKRSKTTQAVEFDICIVEKGIYPNPRSDLEVRRTESWATLLLALNSFCHQHSPRVVVALSPSDEPRELLLWMSQFLDYKITVTNPIEAFATYKAIDSSDLSIGTGSTALVEALSRQKKCLSVDYTSTGFWDLPGEGIARLYGPNNDELFARIGLIARLTWASYSSQLPYELLSLVVDDPIGGIEKINSTIKTDIRS